MTKLEEAFRDKWIGVEEGSHLQAGLIDIFFDTFSMKPYPLGEMSTFFLDLIAKKEINLLVTHPITSEQKLILEAHKQIPVVVIRGNGNVEGPGDEKMFGSFEELGIPVINKVPYFQHGYLINKFARDIVTALATQVK